MVCIKIIVNDVMDAPFVAEHGLSLALYTDSGLTLFDVGQGGALVHNAQTAGVDLSSVSRLVFSHGHYDHTGGFVALLEQGAKPEVCFAPGLTDARFSRHVNKPVKNIAIPDVCRRALDSYPAEKKRIISCFTEIEPGMFLTGPIPHLSGAKPHGQKDKVMFPKMPVSAFPTSNQEPTLSEDVGGPFFLDAAGTRPDPIADEQAILFDDGTLVVGCCHAGIINTVRYCQSVKPEIKIRKIIGGLHLLNASQERIDQTKAFLDSLNLEELTAIHCTGVAELTYPLVDKRHI